LGLHGRAEYLLQDDSENEETYDRETPKISKVLDSISKMMNWVERQSGCDHFHLLHLQNIKTYVCDEEMPSIVTPKESIGLF
jgi:hypothetical protein